MSPGSPSRWRRPSGPLPRPWARPRAVGPFFCSPGHGLLSPAALFARAAAPLLPCVLPAHALSIAVRRQGPTQPPSVARTARSPTPAFTPPTPPTPPQHPHQQPCTRPLFPRYGAYCPLSCLCPQRRCKVLPPPLTTRTPAPPKRRLPPTGGADPRAPMQNCKISAAFTRPSPAIQNAVN